MKTHEDIYGMMRTAIVEYIQLHNCYDVMFCRKCGHYSYCGMNSIRQAMLMIFDY